MATANPTPIKFLQKMDLQCVLAIFPDRTSKPFEIALGQDEVAARKAAQQIIDIIKASDGTISG